MLLLPHRGVPTCSSHEYMKLVNSQAQDNSYISCFLIGSPCSGYELLVFTTQVNSAFHFQAAEDNKIASIPALPHGVKSIVLT